MPTKNKLNKFINRLFETVIAEATNGKDYYKYWRKRRSPTQRARFCNRECGGLETCPISEVCINWMPPAYFKTLGHRSAALCVVVNAGYGKVSKIFSAQALYGMNLSKLYWVRQPTSDERDIALCCLVHAGGVELNYISPKKPN